MEINDLKEKLIEISMALFKVGSTNLVGIDIGVSAIKIAEVLPNGKNNFKLNRFASVPLPESCLIDDELLKPDEIIKTLIECYRKSGITNKNVCISIFGPNTMAKRLQVSGSSKNEVEDQVMWESEQYIPFGIDDSTISYHIVGENEGGGTEVVIAAARNDIVERFHNIIKDAGFKLKVVDLKVFAITNVFEVVLKESLSLVRGGILLIDFGAQSTNLVIYHKGSVFFNREINIGGVMITEEIQRQMGVNFEEAEDLKTRGDENGNLPEEIVTIIDMVLESFFNEIKKTLNFFMTASSEVGLEQCFITGGTSIVPGLMHGLESSLGMSVSPINIFSRFEYNVKNIPEEMIPYINHCGCVAIGLAMRNFGK